MGTLKAISLSYKNAPLSIRELFVFNENKCKKFILLLREQFDLNETLVISTCNRTEIYYVSDISLNGTLVDFLFEFLEIKEDSTKDYFIGITDNKDAIQYLFEVACGLQAQIVGDLQIIGQVKDAYQWSADLNMAGPFLHRLLHSIFYTNKRIVQETAFRDGAASMSYAATELINDITNGNKLVKILLIGVGEIGTNAVQNLLNFGYKDLTLCNRTLTVAQELADSLFEESKPAILPYEDLSDKLLDFDVIISAVEVSTPIIKRVDIAEAKLLSHKMFIDLSVPRSIETEVEKIPGALLFNIEDLNKKTSEAQEKRQQAIPLVSGIIGEAISEFITWSKEMEISPTIHKLKNALETIRKEELSRYHKLSEKETVLIDTITKNIVQKIIKLPAIQLKAACQRGDATNLVEIINELFNLEKSEPVAN